jgi:NADP-dependent 3-hydroxy acid dehydrogenase YdfG
VRLSLAAVATAGAAAAVAAYRRRRPEDDMAGEVALVTGSSRGLGLLIATELARRGCRLLLCARDGAELERAADRLRSTGAQVATVTCDVTREESAGQLVDAARERYGRLDIPVNNAGIIRVGPVQSTNPADYEAALATMTMAPVRLTLAALPVMRAQGHGRIVTITSIGGKLSVPHLLPNSTAKFAAVGFSEGLRAACRRGPRGARATATERPEQSAAPPGNSPAHPVTTVVQAVCRKLLPLRERSRRRGCLRRCQACAAGTCIHSVRGRGNGPKTCRCRPVGK